ncbi:putative fumarylpyruvate hydrolase [Pseudomonas sp. BAY1663]|nr:putative fumarylpyruvate hydrolase [Pseudomonas sp. BAY1663]
MNSTEPTQYLFDPVIPSLAVAGSDRRFPVRRVYCVGRNYAEHAREMGHDPDREPPFFFTKHPDGLLPDGGVFPYPPAPATCTTRSSWWWRSAAAVPTFRSRRPSNTSTAMPWGWT